MIHTSLADWLMMSAFIVVPMAIMVGICAVVEGDFWRVLIGGGLIGLIKYIELDIFDLPVLTYPINKKIKKETERYKDYLKTIYDRDKKSYDKYDTVTL